MVWRMSERGRRPASTFGHASTPRRSPCTRFRERVRGAKDNNSSVDRDASMVTVARVLVLLLLVSSLGVNGCQRPVDRSQPADARPAFPPASPSAPPLHLSDQEVRGRVVYQEGTSHSGGPITAVIGSGGEIPASLIACANCHGRDGRGAPEGNLIPPDLTWSALTKPYETVRRDGRVRPPYTDVLITRAITLGVDSAGIPLNAGMPRYRLSLEDCGDLIAYLKRLGHDADPGLTGVELRFGVIVPPDADGLTDALRGVVNAYFEAINRRGGIYHRRIVVRFVVMPHAADERPAALESFVNSDPPVFALISMDRAGVDPSPAAVAEQRHIPLVAVCVSTPDRPLPGRWAFSMLAGAADQALALARVAREAAPATAPIGIVHGADPAQVSLAHSIAVRGGRAKFATLDVEANDADESAAALRAPPLVVLLGPPDG